MEGETGAGSSSSNEGSAPLRVFICFERCIANIDDAVLNMLEPPHAAERGGRNNKNKKHVAAAPQQPQQPQQHQQQQQRRQRNVPDQYASEKQRARVERLLKSVRCLRLLYLCRSLPHLTLLVCVWSVASGAGCDQYCARVSRRHRRTARNEAVRHPRVSNLNT